MRKWYWILTILVVVTALLNPQTQVRAAEPPPTDGLQSSPDPEVIDPALINAFEKDINSGAKSTGEVLAFVMYDPVIDHVEYSRDGQTALLWLALKDPETEQLIAAEPALAIARVDSSQKSLQDGSLPWDITIQADANWSEVFQSLPPELVSDDLQQRFAAPDDIVSKDVKTVYRGYKLPWAGGLTKRLSGSIGHFLVYYSCSETSCRYAYDFADGTMFPLLAARGGTVYRWNTSCPNYSTDCTNYLVLKDESTSPTTYQLYMHMAQNTVPQALLTVGASVVQGQFIGNVDDTGASTAHHLHFHVHTNATSYWGNSVDVRFDDVSINDGTPRTCSEVASFPNYGTECMRGDPNTTSDDNRFTSGNYGAFPPSGGLIMPTHGQEINETSLLVGGWARDDVGIQKVQIIARTRGEDWKVIGPDLSGTSFVGDINLCDAGVANGPVDIAARIYDLEGNLIPGGMTGLRTIVNNAPCTQTQPPACVPSADQVSLYSEANYQGICQTFNVGEYNTTASLGSIGDNNVESLMVGSNVRAMLYDYDNGGGRGESFEENDANLRDNRLSANLASSLRVVSRSTQPIQPTIDTIFNDYRRLILYENESYVVDFSAYGAVSFRGELRGPVNKDLAYTTQNSWSLGSLPAGGYTLTIWGKNSAGEKNSSRSFNVISASLPNNTQVTAPVTFDFQSGAQNWNGVAMWHLADVTFSSRTSKVWLFNDLYDPATGVGDLGDPNIGGGDLTSPPIRIPSSGYYLQFEYYYQTESFYSYWDQRWLQISVDNGAFENLVQLNMDADKAWLNSQIINLSAYSGKTIRLRFHMDIVDRYYNGGNYGWFVDNVVINTTAPVSCTDTEPNNSISQATLLVSDGQASAFICPGGDMDYYRLNLSYGQQLIFDVDAKDIGSLLDPYLFLYDSNGKLILENDDEEYSVHRDSKIFFTPNQSGTYYLMVKAWDHPRGGSSSHFYTLKVSSTDLTPPVVDFNSPRNTFIPSTTFTVSATATDAGTGIKKVDFYWRNADILNSSWELLGSDSDGSNGWTAQFNPQTHAPVLNGFLVTQAFDQNDNQDTSMRIISGFDNATPTSQLFSLPATSTSTLVTLRWSGSDPDGGLASFDVQYQRDNGTWTNLQTGIPASQTSLVFFAELNHSYGFRMRAIDNNNNIESYPDSAEATTSVLNCSGDAFESDDNSGSKATLLAIDTPQNHNFCGINDIDWVKMNVEAGKEYLFMIPSLGGNAAMRVQMYASNQTTLIKDISSTGFGQSVTFQYTAASTQTIYLKVTPLDSRLAGNGVQYSIWYGKGYFYNFPLVFR